MRSEPRESYVGDVHQQHRKEVSHGETLTRWDPFAELGELRTRFDRMFDGWLDGRERAWTPAIDVVREDGHLVVRADLPGIKPEEVKIEVEDDILTVSGEHTESRRRKGPQLRAARAPLRVLPPLDGAAGGVDAKKIEAKTQDGVVEVTIPLPTEAKQEPVTITPTAS